jgi:hypothetical protein
MSNRFTRLFPHLKLPLVFVVPAILFVASPAYVGDTPCGPELASATMESDSQLLSAFADIQWVNILGAIGGLLGGLAGFYGAFIARRTSNQQYEQQQRLLSLEEEREKQRELEQTRAFVIARIRRAHEAMSQSPMYYIELTNSSNTIARDISIVVKRLHTEGGDLTKLEIDYAKVMNEIERRFSLIGPHSSICFRLYRKESFDEDFAVHVSLEWTNKFGDKATYEHILSSHVPAENALSATVMMRRL